MPSRRLAATPGWVLSSFRASAVSLRLGGKGGVCVVGLAHPPFDLGAEPLGQHVGDVADLVKLAASQHRIVEHVQHRPAQRLGPVQHRQDRPGDVQVALAQPDE